MSEQRQNQRVPEKADITVKVEHAPEAKALEGMVFSSSSVDISLGGVQLVVPFPVPVGADLELKVIFNHTDRSYWHRGIVIWDDSLGERPDDKAPHRIGVQFNTLDNPQFYSWRTTISALLLKQGIYSQVPG